MEKWTIVRTLNSLGYDVIPSYLFNTAKAKPSNRPTKPSLCKPLRGDIEPIERPMEKSDDRLGRGFSGLFDL